MGGTVLPNSVSVSLSFSHLKLSLGKLEAALIPFLAALAAFLPSEVLRAQAIIPPDLCGHFAHQVQLVVRQATIHIILTKARGGEFERYVYIGELWLQSD